MLARRMLGEWTYKEDGLGHAGDPRDLVGGIRILESAKLVLVDERGEGVLIS